MSYSLPKISNEQLNIVQSLKNSNISVDAVAGSGKTTTILYIAKEYKNSNILLLTYSSKLKIESRNKVKKLKINNIEVHSYHSFGVKYYYDKAYNNEKIRKIIKNNLNKNKINNYDIIILDEIQDMTPLYFHFFVKIVNDLKKNVKVCILGDKNQNIFAFNNSDFRFLTLSEKIFNFCNKLPWINLKLSESFRVTKQIAEFVNTALLNENRIISNKDGEKVRYIICNTFDTNDYEYNRKSIKSPYQEFKYYLNLGYTVDDFFILAPSCKKNKKLSPILKLANKLTDEGINIYVSENDSVKLDNDIIKNKVVFSTFHQVKGLERKVVMIFNFDESYFRYYAKDKNPYKCPNELYVAPTRCLEKLTLFHHNENNYLPFINKKYIEENCFFIKNNLNIKENKDDKKNKDVSVTDFIRFTNETVMNNIVEKFIKCEEIQKQCEYIDIKSKINQGDIYENVSDITGTAIPAYYEYITTKKLTIDKEKKYKELKNIDIEYVLKKSVKWASYCSGYNYRTYQIKNYDWISNNSLNKAINRLKKHIPNDCIYESKVLTMLRSLNYNKLIGSIDCIDKINKIIWEFKCVKEITNEHKIQLALYIYLHMISNKTKIKIIDDIQNNFENIKKNNFEKNIDCFISKEFKNGNINININEKIYKIKDNYTENIKILNNKSKYIYYSIDNNDIILKGSDILKNNNYYLIDILKKCTDVIKNKDLCIDFILNKNKLDTIRKELLNNDYTYYLFNILDNNIIKISSSLDKLEEMVDYLLENKNYNNSKIDDSNFIINMNNLVNNDEIKSSEINDYKKAYNYTYNDINNLKMDNWKYYNNTMYDLSRYGVFFEGKADYTNDSLYNALKYSGITVDKLNKYLDNKNNSLLLDYICNDLDIYLNIKKLKNSFYTDEKKDTTTSILKYGHKEKIKKVNIDDIKLNKEYKKVFFYIKECMFNNEKKYYLHTSYDDNNRNDYTSYYSYNQCFEQIFDNLPYNNIILITYSNSFGINDIKSYINNSSNNSKIIPVFNGNKLISYNFIYKKRLIIFKNMYNLIDISIDNYKDYYNINYNSEYISYDLINLEYNFDNSSSYIPLNEFISNIENKNNLEIKSKIKKYIDSDDDEIDCDELFVDICNSICYLLKEGYNNLKKELLLCTNLNLDEYHSIDCLFKDYNNNKLIKKSNNKLFNHLENKFYNLDKKNNNINYLVIQNNELYKELHNNNFNNITYDEKNNIIKINDNYYSGKNDIYNIGMIDGHYFLIEETEILEFEENIDSFDLMKTLLINKDILLKPIDFNNFLPNFIKKNENKFNFKYNNSETKNIMILDIETTGLSPYSSYIVQIAYNIYDYNLNLITKKNIIINNGNNIQDFYKKIPLDVINNRGITLIGALNEVLMDMKNCRYIVGHNISFDINFIETKFWKNNIYHNYNYKAICTMKKSRKFVNAKNKSNGIKPPKLCELYKKIYNKDMDENSSHTADYDVEITFQCFKKLVELEIIELD